MGGRKREEGKRGRGFLLGIIYCLVLGEMRIKKMKINCFLDFNVLLSQKFMIEDENPKNS